ncbi:hypothetical protein Syun_008836 [Stephania yunnanensis]|uniref:Bulb-type lectin domain-containing protein n=1 Tax=Stephania yunnanensis TaxID=152371 RepID=A0AAP0KFW7_9MAGN
MKIDLKTINKKHLGQDIQVQFDKKLDFVINLYVSQSHTFKYTNQCNFGEYITEYNAKYRLLDIYASIFTLCFYNTTPNAFTLGSLMGNPNSESILRWVWATNRNRPIPENATLTFSCNNNLILANANGRVARQTNTANKGVVGLKHLNNGDFVLYNA